VTSDLDTLLRDADPLRDRPADGDTALLPVLRDRVDAERADTVPAYRPLHWGRRIGLVAAAAAVLTAVPLVISAVSRRRIPPSGCSPTGCRRAGRTRRSSSARTARPAPACRRP
jgi:hypothetical protein